ncbi:hypothetical protein [Fusobacterium pseudoperiodonticum]|uniref:hypothetical protein n=1 Tax=Fusobacterium pseudoperiodonticum TaxID=2663009 RepID=UPI000C1B8939|nr:hypothetical protein [Fusobacterium pseudoperiodonticum]ATV64546.1 hypothetical protein CTM78_09180 [Fusobacterium pseudoperiodonticum]
MIKYVATVKIQGFELSRTIKSELYKPYYMTDEELEEAEKMLKTDLKKIFGEDIEIVGYHIGVCENGK